MTEPTTEQVLCRKCKHPVEAHNEAGCGAHKGMGNWCQCKATPAQIESNSEPMRVAPMPTAEDPGYPSQAELDEGRRR